MATNPASSSIPSDWYPEKSCAAAAKERKSTTQSAQVRRGHRLRVKRIEQTSPAHTSARSAPSPLESQSKVGAAQTDFQPGSARASASRYSPAGSSPRGPISPPISPWSETNAERKMSPSARRNSQRGQSSPERTRRLYAWFR